MTEIKGLFEKEIVSLFEKSKGKDWLEEARLVAERIGLTGRYVTVNMVRDIVPPPSDIDPRIMGAVFKKKDWERVGYVSSDRSTCHNRPIAIFKFRGFVSEDGEEESKNG